MQSFLRKISVSPSILLGLVVIFLALVLQGLGEPCTLPCNTTSSSISISTSCGSDCSAIEPPGSLARRPPTRRPPPPVRRPPPPPTRRPPPPPVRRPPPPPTRRPPPPPVRRPPPPPTRRPPPPPVRRPPPPPVRRPPPPPTPRPPPPPTPPSPEPPTPPSPEPPTPPTPLTEIITEELFNEFLLDRMYPTCPGRWFYNYHAFITAAEAFPAFGNVGNEETRKREIAAFFGQTSHETAGGVIAHDGPFTWGYCYIAEVGPWMPEYCDPTSGWPCEPGRSYYGRGPVQLRWNYNYGKAGEALGLDLLEDPDLVAHDEVISFETAIWFWMTPQDNKPSSHQVITGQWMPNLEDLASNRWPGYGIITNIFNGRSECGRLVPDNREEGRIELYKRYCDILGVSYGENLSCSLQCPFDGYPFKSHREDNNATLALSTTNKQGHLEPVESA